MNFEEYKKFKKMYEEFILDKQWQYSLLFDCMINDNVKSQVSNMIDFFKANPKTNETSNYLDLLREKSFMLIKNSEKEKDIEEAWFKAREAYAYYGLGEVITEGSVYSEALIDELKGLYGKEYLDIIERIDKNSPSKLTDFNLTDSLNQNYNETINKYLLLKKWQDDQNIYHNKELYPYF